MRLGNALTLTSIYAEGEEELQEASSEAELHGLLMRNRHSWRARVARLRPL